MGEKGRKKRKVQKKYTCPNAYGRAEYMPAALSL
jgi:hypothetical protein